MWMAEPMEGEVVGEIPTYAPAFKEVYRFILEAMDGNVFAATDLFQKYLAGEMPERLLSISRLWVKAEQADADRHPTPHLWPLNHKGCGEHAARAIELDALKLRPTGLGPGIDKDRPDHTVYTGRCLFGLP